PFAANGEGAELELRTQAVGEVGVLGAHFTKAVDREVSIQLRQSRLGIQVEDGQRQRRIQQAVGGDALVVHRGIFAIGLAEVDVLQFRAEQRSNTQAGDQLPAGVL